VRVGTRAKTAYVDDNVIMFKTCVVIAVVCLLGAGTITTISGLEDRAGSAHDAQVRVAALRSQFDLMQAVPWAVSRDGVPRAGNLAALTASRHEFVSAVQRLLDGSPPASLRSAATGATANYAQLVHVYRVGVADHGWPRLVSARLYRAQALSHGGVTTLLVSASGQYDQRAERAEFDVKLGSAAAIAVLIAAFILFFVRWASAARSRERALKVVDEQSDELRHLALHDALTGLPNRVLIIDRTQQMLARAQRDGLAMAALFIDLDGFKAINDSFGHAAGDALLRAVGERLQLAVRDADTVGRLGGDEFVVLTEGGEFDAGPELVAERLLEVLRLPFDLGEGADARAQVTASIGIAVGGRSSADELLRDADVALYEAKGAGKDRYIVFQQEMQVAVQDRLSLEMDLRDALAHDELFVVYQPTFELQSGRASGFEALVRWQHPSRGLLMPAQFIPVAEQSRLIVDVGRRVLFEACSQAAAWHRQGYPIEMAVNVSTRQLDDLSFEETVREALDESGLDPRFLILEITETTLMRNPERVATRLAQLKQLGIRLAIDDFGTGYSSLAYLRQFPMDSLKIDRSFITGLGKSSEAQALVHSLVQLGKSLHLDIVAEGIEHDDQLRRLRAESCNHGQGFLLARPLKAQAATRFLATRTGRTMSVLSQSVGVA
jgi:diguanylate cyclase (GGDEF)-like protein